MKYLHTFAIVLLSVFVLQAQNIGINATGANPDPSAALDVVSSSSGVLIPRVALTGTSDATTIVNGNVNSLLVFNTATVSDVTPGYYYWSASDNAWIRIEDQNSVSDDWRLTGNAGTNPATNFLGTTDAQDLVLRTNNTENMRIANATGFVGIGTAAPTELLEVNGNISSNNGTTKAVLGQGGGTTSFVGNTTAHRFDVITNNTPAITVLANSNVGIGSTAPSHPLHVIGNSLTTGFVFVGSQGVGGGTPSAIMLGGNPGVVDGYTFRNDLGNNGVLIRAESTPASAFVCMDNLGRLGLGTTNPSGADQFSRILEIAAGNAFARPVIRLNRTTSEYKIGVDDVSNFLDIVNTNGNIMPRWGTGIHIDVNGRVAIGAAPPSINYALELANNTTNTIGRARANAWATYSDGRIKTDQQLINYGLNTVMQLQAKQYTQHSSTFKEGKLMLEGPTEHTIGFIAQELYEVVPEAVYKPQNEDEDLWSVDYTKLTPVLVKAIQEQQKKINQQEEQINQQEEQINQQEEQANQQKYLIEKLIKQNEALNQRLTVLEKQ